VEQIPRRHRVRTVTERLHASRLSNRITDTVPLQRKLTMRIRGTNLKPTPRKVHAALAPRLGRHVPTDLRAVDPLGMMKSTKPHLRINHGATSLKTFHSTHCVCSQHHYPEQSPCYPTQDTGAQREQLLERSEPSMQHEPCHQRRHPWSRSRTDQQP